MCIPPCTVQHQPTCLNGRKDSISVVVARTSSQLALHSQVIVMCVCWFHGLSLFFSHWKPSPSHVTNETPRFTASINRLLSLSLSLFCHITASQHWLLAPPQQHLQHGSPESSPRGGHAWAPIQVPQTMKTLRLPFTLHTYLPYSLIYLTSP